MKHMPTNKPSWVKESILSTSSEGSQGYNVYIYIPVNNNQYPGLTSAH